MKRTLSLIHVVLILAWLLSACTQPTAAPTAGQPPASSPAPTVTPPPAATTAAPTAAPTSTTPDTEQPIYLAIIWHQHQPVYFKDPQTGIYAKPWVRVHAAKDYVDMAAILKNYPNIHATFNLTPSLLRQVDDFIAGAKDLYWVTAEVPADQLTAEQKQFLLERFFDTNRKIIARFPRYQELLEKRDAQGEYSEQDFRDLQVLFNLAWTDPDWLAQEPLAALVAKGQGFSEADKAIVFAEHLRLIKEIVPLHKQMQDAGQIEVTMTPFAHPILPLLITTDLAKVALPDITLPSNKFVFGQDAVAQVELGIQLYQDHFGQAPRGMWPAEGSVAQEIVTLVAKRGIQWMASDEGVLANSLGMPSFTRSAKEVVNEPQKLYTPYIVSGKDAQMYIIFRDVVISDKVGFTYSGMAGDAAAQDFINRIHAIRQALMANGGTGPYLVSVILDGENAWEYYDNDGKLFLNSLYQMLSEDPLIKTVTPSEYLALNPEQPKIEKLWAGSWISHDFSTWIGETEENRAWDYLFTTRDLLQKYISGVRQASPEALEKAKTQMYIAEGSDWFWWYGADQNSGNDESFDLQFRQTLKQVYLALGEEPPRLLDVPIIEQRAATADVAASGLISPTLDGIATPAEWASAGVYTATGGVMAQAAPYFASLAYGFDSRNLFFKIAATAEYTSAGASGVEIYLSVPGGDLSSPFSRNDTLLGFQANRMVSVQFDTSGTAAATLYTVDSRGLWQDSQSSLPVAYDLASKTLEIGVPLAQLGQAETGDRLTLRALHVEALMGANVDSDMIPASGPALISVPDLGLLTIVLNVDDPAGDDYGPGNYTYPTDGVFHAGNFDVLNFQVGYDDENIVFKFTMRGAVDNPWGSPNGLALQTFDIYIDKDGDGVGGVVMLPGRNLAFQEGYAWDYAITAEGWEPGIFVPGTAGAEKVAQASQFTILADPGQQKVTIRVPKSILGDNPQDWKYAAVVLSQEGFPSGGVMRVRDGQPKAGQWRFGGVPEGVTNYTRVFDFVWSEAGQQEAWLSAYTASNTPQTELSAADFAKVPMLVVVPK